MKNSCSFDKPNYKTPHSTGMTLVELVLVAGLLGLLLSFAVPTYQRYLERGHRVEAIQLLLTAAACQERNRARQGTFDTTLCLGNSDSQFYRLIITPEGQSATPEFVLIAEPLERQKLDICGSLSLDQSGTRGISGPDDRLQKCWSAR